MRRARLGLRIRIVAALLAVAAVALAGPAYELLSPLQLRLRERTMHHLTVRAEQIGRDVRRLPKSSITPHASALRQLDRQLTYRNLDATIVGPSGHYLFGYDTDITNMVRRGTGPAIGQVQHRVINYGYGWGYWARVVIRVPSAGGPVTIAVYRSLQDAGTARSALVSGLERAAAVSLLIAVAFGMLLANGIVRRTRSLRDMALSVAAHGPGGTGKPDDHADEIGDLARAFGTMRERLHAHEVARERFVATASHELRTPITGLQLRLGMLREDLESGAPDLADAGEQVRLAERQAQRLAKLAGDLLELSRLDAEVALPLSPVAVGPLVQAVAAEFEGIGGAEVTADVTHAGTALGDERRIAQIVRILIDNARRYAPPDRPVRVSVVGPTVTVEDDGPGVGADERDLIFERFRRGEGHHDESGFGLGLAIGQELAQLMQGQLTIESRARPTRFQLRLRPAVGALPPSEPSLPEPELAS